MQCPYCGNEMVKGYIYGDRYRLKWLPEDKKLLMGIWANGGVKLGSDSILGRPKVETYMCESCKKLIINTNE